tara:strand:+ start:854 stop:1465 length:612 start_codon:yes stop_codon:yes gene_type:complete
MIRAVFFDLDGVLVDACEWHRIALNTALKRVCDYEISVEDHHNIFNGLPTRVKLKKLTEMGVIESAAHEQVYRIKQQITLSTIEKNAKKRAEKIELMKFLKGQGCHIACYTNSIKDTATLMLKKTGIFDYIECLVTNQDVLYSKPHPEGYNFLLKKFNLKSKNVIIVEDSPKGKQAAYSSGCRVIEVNHPNDVVVSLFEGAFK